MTMSSKAVLSGDGRRIAAATDRAADPLDAVLAGAGSRLRKDDIRRSGKIVSFVDATDRR